MRLVEVGDVIGLDGWPAARVIGIKHSLSRKVCSEVTLETGQTGALSDAWLHAIPDEEAEDGYRVVWKKGG